MPMERCLMYCLMSLKIHAVSVFVQPAAPPRKSLLDCLQLTGSTRLVFEASSEVQALPLNHRCGPPSRRSLKKHLLQRVS
jgi:hypothetical protein